MEERRRRNKMLTILSEKKKRAFYEKHIGENRLVLFEAHKDKSLISGFTDNYIKIEMPFEEGLINTVAEVDLREINHNGLVESMTLRLGDFETR